MIPCISKNSLKNLYSTADERYNFSKEYFRETHFTQTLNHFYNNKLIDALSDEGFYDELVDSVEYNNRIFLIFGSTGSGKSELLCWLKDKWEVRENSRPVIRISRSELNPQVLIKKCMETLGLELSDINVDEKKWSMLLTKPITILNQIVWNTMSEFFEKDEEIVPITMTFRPVIEKNIQEFAQQIKKGKVERPLELISKEEFDRVLENTTVPIDINYKKLRNSLLKNLDQFLFEGFEVKAIFKRFSEELSKRKIRPLLLIDDLVQSINLYAADILDYFITLEEGNWDVVIGLTPGVEQDSELTTELKERINNLDTIDDRVKKYWLSDESGSNSYTINKDQTKDYVKNYLVALKKTNGFSCGMNCPNAKSCSYLLSGSVDLLPLPFNNFALDRIYGGIPEGKGKLRYIILHLKELLRFFSSRKEKDIEKIKNYYKRDVYIDHDNNLIKFLGEFYSDPLSSNYTITQEMLSGFMFESENVNLKVNKVGYSVRQLSDQLNKPNITSKGKTEEHIRDWIEGKNIKEELLEPIKSGVVTLLNESISGHNIMKEHTPRAIKSKSTIQRNESLKGYKYPFSFEQQSNEKNVLKIEKRINLLSIANLQEIRIQDRWQIFSEVSNDHNVARWIYQGDLIKDQWRKELTESLGINISNFAFQLKNFMTTFLCLENCEWIPREFFPFSRNIQESVEQLFLDWFSLRDNIIDYHKISQLRVDRKFEQWFLNFVPAKKLNKYSFGSIPFQTFLLNLQNDIVNYYQEIAPFIKEKLEEIINYNDFIQIQSPDHHKILLNLILLETEELLTLGNIQNLDFLVRWFSMHKEQELIEWEKQKTQNENIINVLGTFEERSDFILKIKNIEEAESYLKDNLKLRKQVSYHIINIIEHGHSQLPRKQWRGILKDLYDHSPDLFEKVSIQLSIRK
jgi:hypothetical protein